MDRPLLLYACSQGSGWLRWRSGHLTDCLAPSELTFIIEDGLRIATSGPAVHTGRNDARPQEEHDERGDDGEGDLFAGGQCGALSWGELRRGAGGLRDGLSGGGGGCPLVAAVSPAAFGLRNPWRRWRRRLAVGRRPTSAAGRFLQGLRTSPGSGLLTRPFHCVSLILCEHHSVDPVAIGLT